MTPLKRIEYVCLLTTGGVHSVQQQQQQQQQNQKRYW